MFLLLSISLLLLLTMPVASVDTETRRSSVTAGRCDAWCPAALTNGQHDPKVNIYFFLLFFVFFPSLFFSSLTLSLTLSLTFFFFFLLSLSLSARQCARRGGLPVLGVPSVAVTTGVRRHLPTANTIQTKCARRGYSALAAPNVLTCAPHPSPARRNLAR